MKLFENLKLKFEHPNWANDLELGLVDTILDEHPALLTILQADIAKGTTKSVFGRKDTPSVE